MAEPRLTPNASSSSSSNKRSYDAIGPEGDVDRSNLHLSGRSRRDSPTPSPSSAEGSRERNKRARNDRDSSYTSEVEDLLLTTGNPVSPSSSGSSHSSYHSAHSTLPTAASPPVLDSAEDDMLVDPVFVEPILPEPRLPSPAVEPPWVETVLPLPPRQSPISTSDTAASRAARLDSYDEFRRSLERASAFDREIAPLRSSPAAVPTSTPRNTGPLPPVQLPPGLDDVLGLQVRNPYVPGPPHPELIDIDFVDPPREFWPGSTFLGRANDLPVSSSSNPANRPGPLNDRIADVHGRTISTRDDWSRRVRELSRSRQRLAELHASASASASQDVQNQETFWLGLRSSERNNIRPQGPRPQSGRAGYRSQNDNVIFEDPSEHEDILYLLDAATSTHEDRFPRSPRNHPPLAGSRLLDLLEDRNAGSSTNSPHTSLQPGPSVGSPFVGRSPRFSAPSATIPALPDEYLERTHERRMRELDRTVREAEAHRRRVTEFLASTIPPLPSYPSTQTPESTVPTSSYSTLRHALDDNAGGEPIRQDRRSNEQVSALAFAQPRAATSRESNAVGSFARPFWDVLGDLSYELPWREDTHEAISDFVHPPRRRGPFRARTVEEMAATLTGADREPSPPGISRRETPPLPVYNDLALPRDAFSLLEANSRARSVNLSGLRHRARPRSPSPPAPAPHSSTPPVIPTASTSPSRHRASPRSRSPAASQPPSPPPLIVHPAYRNHREWGIREEPSGSRYSPMDRYYPPRRAEDNAMLQAFTDPPAPTRRPSPERAPSDVLRPGEARGRSVRYGNINLDAYRDGPFRATLARSVALQNRAATDRRAVSDNGTDRANPSSPSSWARLTPTVEESPRIHAGFDRRDVGTAGWEARLNAPPRRPRARTEALDGHSEEELSSDWEFAFLNPTGHTIESMFDPPSVRTAPTSAAPPPPPMAPLTPPRSTPRVNLLSETRTYAVRGQPSSRVTVRHRTLLDREHASNGPWGDDPAARTAAAAARLERVDRRREMMYRAASRQLPAAAANPRPPTDTSRTSELGTDSSSDVSHIQMWSRRYVAHREARAEDRQAPLNGRFARRGGLGQHYPPDMVWVDVPPGRTPWNRNRRNIGDYMRDEDFDVSYEGLLSLSSLLGDVKPRGTPADIITSLPKGTYSEWARPGTTEERCPICLDDYQPTDQCLRICDCSHWFHEGCLQQWLKGARTCPVCRGRVRKPPSKESPEPVAGPSGSNHRDRDRDDDSDGEDADDPRRRRWNPFRPPWRHD